MPPQGAALRQMHMKNELRAAGTFQWTTPAGRQYTTEPTRYPI